MGVLYNHKQKRYDISMKIITKEEKAFGLLTSSDFRIKKIPLCVGNALEELKCRTGASKREICLYGIMLLARKSGIEIPSFKGKAKILGTVKARLKKEIHEE